MMVSSPVESPNKSVPFRCHVSYDSPSPVLLHYGVIVVPFYTDRYPQPRVQSAKPVRRARKPVHRRHKGIARTCDLTLSVCGARYAYPIPLPSVGRLEKYRSRKARQEEYEDPESVIADKSAALAEAIRSARHLVVYTGAGVSTSASIPDYRGPDGIWTRLSQGRGIG